MSAGVAAHARGVVTSRVQLEVFSWAMPEATAGPGGQGRVKQERTIEPCLTGFTVYVPSKPAGYR